MLTNSEKDLIRQGLVAISKTLPNFRSREGQRIMIAEIAKALGNIPTAKPDTEDASSKFPLPAPGTAIACINGGTGIGKSLAYSLPGAILARARGRKLVISTATVALQEQLIGKDLPVFLKAAGLGDLTMIMAKGRSRYVCIHKLAHVVGEKSQGAMFDEEGTTPDQQLNTQTDVDTRLPALLADYTASRWSGDRDELDGIDDATWSSITTDRHGCIGRNCPSAKNCAQTKAKNKAREADVIVANHDLILADLAMGGGLVLPKPEECIFVFDEGHHLADKAVSSFASSHHLGASSKLLRKLPDMAGALTNTLGPGFAEHGRVLTESALELADDLDQAFSYFDELNALKPTEKTPTPLLDFEMSCIPDGFDVLGGNILNRANAILGALDVARGEISEMMGKGNSREALFQKLASDIGFHIGKTEEIQTTWKLFLAEPREESPPIAKWVEAVVLRGHADFRLSSSPVIASGLLRKFLWEKCAGAIMASASLTTMGSFDDLLATTGLRAYADVQCIDLPSAFDYQEQATLEIPRMTATPKDYQRHTEGVTEWISTRLPTLKAEGALVLFTSKRQLNAVAGAIPPELRKTVLIQGNQPKSAILAEHKQRIDRGESSTIFGLESFSEGVDLAGTYCSLVVIPALPFPVPDNPVMKALSKWLESRGRNPFDALCLPIAARKLEQRAGRLIRTESDTGTIAVLDSRLWNTGYGKRMLKGLPPFRLLVNDREMTI